MRAALCLAGLIVRLGLAFGRVDAARRYPQPKAAAQRAVLLSEAWQQEAVRWRLAAKHEADGSAARLTANAVAGSLARCAAQLLELDADLRAIDRLRVGGND